MESEPVLTTRKNPLYRKKKSPHRSIEPTTPHQAEQRDQHTTSGLFRPPCSYSTKMTAMVEVVVVVVTITLRALTMKTTTALTFFFFLPISLLSWLFGHSCMNTGCFGCLNACFAFLYLYCFRTIENISQGKAL